jgi:ribosomal protein S18 acetylase RimI-like enzyme
MTIREATRDDIPGIARVHVNTWRTAYRGIVPDSFFDSLTYESRAADWQNEFPPPELGGFVYVAEVDGEIAGFVLAGPPDPPRPDYDGEIGALHVTPEHQGKGLGRALVRAVARRLGERGAATMLLYVFSDNEPARRFYEALGGELLNERTLEIAGKMIHEVAYGWRDITTLLAGEQEERS